MGEKNVGSRNEETVYTVVSIVNRLIFVYNFFVYLITGRQFRSELRRLCCCCCTSAAAAAAGPATTASAVANDDDDDGDRVRRGDQFMTSSV